MKVGLYGASTTHILCRVDECIELFNKIRKKNDSEIIDRLYRKIIRIKDIPELKQNLTVLLLTDIDKKQKKLVEKILNTLSFFYDCAEHDLRKYGEYSPLRIILAEIPYDILSDNIPLEDYDNNDGEPFWMRPKYILDRYSKRNRK